MIKLLSLLFVLALMQTGGMVQLTIWSQKLGRRFAWYAKHEELHLLLLLFSWSALFLGVSFVLGVALYVGATP